MKSDIRNPKSEGRPKTEVRSPLTWLGAGSFGLRVSDFFRISDFGFRISEMHAPR